MKIKDINNNDRPRERLINKGISSLSDQEVLAIILNTGIKGMSAIELANYLINKYGLNNLFNLSYETLIKETGIKEAKACKLIASFELARRAFNSSTDNIYFKDSIDIYNYIKDDYKYHNNEKVIVLLLNNKLKLIKKLILDDGAKIEIELNVKKIVSNLLSYDAYGFILCHNHPTGDSTPSDSDKRATANIYRVAKGLNIHLLDHVIIGNDNYFSFLENHLFDFLD